MDVDRWDTELAFKLIERESGLHLLWSEKLVVVQQQAWPVLILSQALQALRLKIAGRHGVDVFEVFIPLSVQNASRLAVGG